MNIIEQVLTGQMEMKEFVALLQSDPTLQRAISKLVPQEAVSNPNHAYWTITSYESLEEVRFDYFRQIQRFCRFDNSIEDNFELFALLASAYQYYHPDLLCTPKYREAFDLYLDVIRDCFDGPEVSSVVDQIINDAIPIKPKSKRLKEAKANMNAQFHVINKQYPRWIQGPEWPMGVDSPMQYVGRKRINDGVAYSFVDVTTGAIRVVEQYY